LGVLVLFLLLYIGITQYFSNKFKLDPKFGSTLACGLGVCGVSAVVATGGALQLKAKDLAYAVGVILVFDIVTVFLWPIIGTAFSIPGEVFGPWTGISMLSTGTTVAAGFAHSEIAGELATILKMARNATIGLWALFFVGYYANRGLSRGVTNKAAYVWTNFPKFVIGFIFIMILANSGALSGEEVESLKNAYGWLFMMAFVGLGYDVKLKELKKVGIKPLMVAIIAVLTVSLLSLLLLYKIFA